MKKVIAQKTNHFIIIKEYDSFVIMKAGDMIHIPDYDHPIINDYRRLIYKKTKIVLCLVHSFKSKIAYYRYKEGMFYTKAPKSEFIFKMPHSPLHTFIVVNIKNIGTIEAISDRNKVLCSIDLRIILSQIHNLKLSLDEYNRIDFSRLPLIVHD